MQEEQFFQNPNNFSSMSSNLIMEMIQMFLWILLKFAVLFFRQYQLDHGDELCTYTN